MEPHSSKVKIKKNLKTSLLIDICDIYGTTYNLNIFGEQKYKTTFGAIVGILSMLFIWGTSIYFLIGLFQRKTFTIINNDETSRTPINNITDSPILISLVLGNGKFIPLEGIWNITAILYSGKIGNDGNTQIVVVPLEFEKCDPKKHFGKYKNLLQNSFGDKLENFLCLPADKYNLTLSGIYGNYALGWTSLYMFINKCNPELSKVSCLNETSINSILSSAKLLMGHISNYVDNYNLTITSQKKIETYIFGLSTKMMKQFNVFLKQVNYITDYGFLFEDYKTENFHTADSYKEEVYDMPYKSTFSPGPTISMIQISNKPGVSNMFKIFGKGQVVLANIGGVVKAVMVFSQLLVNILTNKLSIIDISNYLFEFPEDLKINEDCLNLNNSNSVIQNSEFKMNIQPSPVISKSNNKLFNNFKRNLIMNINPETIKTKNEKKKLNQNDKSVKDENINEKVEITMNKNKPDLNIQINNINENELSSHQEVNSPFSDIRKYKTPSNKTPRFTFDSNTLNKIGINSLNLNKDSLMIEHENNRVISSTDNLNKFRIKNANSSVADSSNLVKENENNKTNSYTDYSTGIVRKSKSRELKFSLRQHLCLANQNDSRVIDYCKELIYQKISIENIIKNTLQNERLASLVLNENQLIEFNNYKKIMFDLQTLETYGQFFHKSLNSINFPSPSSSSDHQFNMYQLSKKP